MPPTHPLPPRSVGLWSRELRYGDPVERVDAAAELDELGFAVLWIPGGDEDQRLEVIEEALRATRRTIVATGILSIWAHEPATVATLQRDFERAYPGRFLLGLGVSHAPIVDAAQPGRYRKPLTAMADFLDALDGAHAPPTRAIAALAPRMLELARERSQAVHPYLVPIAHTHAARQTLGPDVGLAPALSVVLDTDVERARGRARGDLALYFALPNYVRTWQRLGFDDSDFVGGGSDRLVDALYALGSLDLIGERVRAHFDAGADHVCLRVVTGQPTTGAREPLPREAWHELSALV